MERRASEVTLLWRVGMISTIIRCIENIRKLMKKRSFECTEIRFYKRAVKKDIEILDFRITCMVMFRCFFGKIVRVNMGYNFTF